MYSLGVDSNLCSECPVNVVEVAAIGFVPPNSPTNYARPQPVEACGHYAEREDLDPATCTGDMAGIGRRQNGSARRQERVD